MSNPCPYCGLEDDIDYVAAGVPPFHEGDVLVCEGCGCVEVATGFLWETRLPAADDPAVALLRRALHLAQRPRITERFARRFGAPGKHQQMRGHSP